MPFSEKPESVAQYQPQYRPPTPWVCTNSLAMVACENFLGEPAARLWRLFLMISIGYSASFEKPPPIAAASASASSSAIWPPPKQARTGQRRRRLPRAALPRFLRGNGVATAEGQAPSHRPPTSPEVVLCDAVLVS